MQMLDVSLAMEDRGLCDPDTKPANIMMKWSATLQRFVLTKIDFGSCVTSDAGKCLPTLPSRHVLHEPHQACGIFFF